MRGDRLAKSISFVLRCHLTNEKHQATKGQGGYVHTAGGISQPVQSQLS